MNLHITGPAQGFWSLLSEADRTDLAALGSLRVYPPGATLSVEGDAATHVFVLIDGWVKILSTTSDGSQLVLALRGQGDLVGETAGVTTGLRNATIRAIDTVRSLIVSWDNFSAFLDSHPGADYAYRRMVTKRWNDSDSLLRNRSMTTGVQRLAAVLLDLADQRGREVNGAIHLALPLTQEELASLAGTSRATVTRALGNWRHRNIIRTGQRHITVTDLRGLRQIARQRSEIPGGQV